MLCRLLLAFRDYSFPVIPSIARPIESEPKSTPNRCYWEHSGGEIPCPPPLQFKQNRENDIFGKLHFTLHTIIHRIAIASPAIPNAMIDNTDGLPVPFTTR